MLPLRDGWKSLLVSPEKLHGRNSGDLLERMCHDARINVELSKELCVCGGGASVGMSQ